MIRTADIVIVGGGVNGAACAYSLARRGMEDIVVLEKGYPGCGATGRCGGGIRQQWGMEENIILARESVKMFENPVQCSQWLDSIFPDATFLLVEQVFQRLAHM